MSEDLKNIVENKSKSAFIYLKTFLKWLVISSLTGAAGGLLGALFSNTLKEANAVRESVPWIIFFLPLGGVLIAGLYKMCGLENDPGTNIVIQSVRTKENVPWIMAPLIFFSTAVTHLLGGSAGREGAALQLGGTLGSFIGRIFHFNEKDMHMAVMCGMSGLFSALFCTPLTSRPAIGCAAINSTSSRSSACMSYTTQALTPVTSVIISPGLNRCCQSRIHCRNTSG